MRTRRSLIPIATLAITLAIGTVPGSVDAKGTETSAGGRTINASAALGGLFPASPPKTPKPCPTDPDAIEGNGPRQNEPYRFQIVGETLDPATRVVDGVTQERWISHCGETAFGTFFWVSTPTPGPMVDALFDIVKKELDDPQVLWPNMNKKFGWLYVKVPMDFRVGNVAPITATATVSNALGSSTASVTATPSSITFSSGEGGARSCTVAQAREKYVPRLPGACAYTYKNSSATASDGYSFDTTMTVTWDITSTPVDPTLPATLETSTDALLPVSEVQAIVTCIGKSC